MLRAASPAASPKTRNSPTASRYEAGTGPRSRRIRDLLTTVGLSLNTCSIPAEQLVVVLLPSPEMWEIPH
jgi:hypothetical protein